MLPSLSLKCLIIGKWSHPIERCSMKSINSSPMNNSVLNFLTNRESAHGRVTLAHGDSWMIDGQNVRIASRFDLLSECDT